MKISVKTLGAVAVLVLAAGAIGAKLMVTEEPLAGKTAANHSKDKCAYTSDFKDNGNGTMTDPRTKLVWQTCALGQNWHAGCSGNAAMMNQAEALKAASDSTYQSASDWRLPSKDELAGIMASADCADAKKWIDPKLATPVDGKDDLGTYWTATDYGKDGYLVWYANFNTGYFGGINSVNYNAVRLVRNGA